MERSVIELRVVDLLKRLGVPTHINGYRYLKTSITLECLNENSYRRKVTKILYPIVAKVHRSSEDRVERSIRHAIEVVFTHGNVELLYDIFGYTISCEKGKATNSHFIITLADTIMTDFIKEQQLNESNMNTNII